MKKVKLSGNLTVDLSNIKSAIVRKHGTDSSSGSVFVPKEWIGEKVVVILMKNGS
jgi:putative transposon-encoded protein